MTVQYSQTPRRQHEQTRARKQDLDQPTRQLTCGRVEIVCKQTDEVRRRQNTDEDDHRRDQHQQREHCVCNPARFFLVVTCEQLCVDRNERGGKRALAENVLQKIRYAKRRTERITGGGGSEVMGENALANQTLIRPVPHTAEDI